MLGHSICDSLDLCCGCDCGCDCACAKMLDDCIAGTGVKSTVDCLNGDPCHIPGREPCSLHGYCGTGGRVFVTEGPEESSI